MANVKRMLCCTGLLWSSLVLRAGGETIFVEAETMQSSSRGWVATSNDQAGRASRVRTLWGANGAGDALASKLEVLSMKQELLHLAPGKRTAFPEANDDEANDNIEILATFQDAKPAVVSGCAGKARVIVRGSLPALSRSQITRSSRWIASNYD